MLVLMTASPAFFKQLTLQQCVASAKLVSCQDPMEMRNLKGCKLLQCNILACVSILFYLWKPLAKNKERSETFQI